MFTTQVSYLGIFKYSLTQFWWQMDNCSNHGLIRGSDPLRMRVGITSPGKPLSQKRWGGKESKMVMRRESEWILKPTADIACPSYSSRLYLQGWDWGMNTATRKGSTSLTFRLSDHMPKNQCFHFWYITLYHWIAFTVSPMAFYIIWNLLFNHREIFTFLVCFRLSSWYKE